MGDQDGVASAAMVLGCAHCVLRAMQESDASQPVGGWSELSTSVHALVDSTKCMYGLVPRTAPLSVVCFV
jgi:hypothetical protein